MAENATLRLNKVLRELNISLDRAVEHLASKGHEIDARPTAKITSEVYRVLLDEFQTDKSKKVASIEVSEEKRKEKEAIRQELEKEIEEKRKTVEKEEVIRAKQTIQTPKTIGKIDLDANKNFRQKGESKKDTDTKEEEQKKTEQKSEVIKPDSAKTDLAKPDIVKPEVIEAEAKKEETVKEVKEKQKEVIEEPEVEITPENSERLQTKYKKL